MQSSIVKDTVAFLAKKFWSWFIRYAWPLLREHMMDLFKWAIELLKDKLKLWANSRGATKEGEARKKAEQADDDARSAPTAHERDKHEAVAQVWREVAEKFRAENELLKEAIERLTAETQTEISTKANVFTPTIDTSVEPPVLVVGPARIPLTALPSTAASIVKR